MTAERFGLSPLVLKQIIAKAGSMPAIERVILYGSRARGDYRAGSDIDIAIDGREVGEYEAVLLRNLLEDTSIVFPIDVSAVPALDPASRFAQRIANDGVTIFERTRTPSAFTTR